MSTINGEFLGYKVTYREASAAAVDHDVNIGAGEIEIRDPNITVSAVFIYLCTI
jgi:hypothetical protein